MNYPELFFSAANTALLVALFFYQRNRNKVLEDQLAAQRQLLDETKAVVTQQAVAIEGQSKVVDSALRYTSAFDPKKLEEVLRREIAMDQKEEISRLKNELQQSGGGHEDQVVRIRALVDRVATATSGQATQLAQDIVLPLMPIVVRALLPLSSTERVEALAGLTHATIKEAILRVVSDTELQLKPSLPNEVSQVTPSK
jgi:uncharacterized coiled-coil protein SlyX